MTVIIFLRSGAALHYDHVRACIVGDSEAHVDDHVVDLDAIAKVEIIP